MELMRLIAVTIASHPCASKRLFKTVAAEWHSVQTLKKTAFIRRWAGVSSGRAAITWSPESWARRSVVGFKTRSCFLTAPFSSTIRSAFSQPATCARTEYDPSGIGGKSYLPCSSVNTDVVMVCPDRRAETVAPPIFSPDSEVTVPVSTTLDSDTLRRSAAGAAIASTPPAVMTNSFPTFSIGHLKVQKVGHQPSDRASRWFSDN